MHFQPIENMSEEPHIVHAQVDVSASNDALDDVFGSGPSAVIDSAVHPSDMHRLQTEHTNAGYLEGVTIAKEGSVQAGFDEGFSLGASVGLVAGQLLGVVEGVAEAAKNEDLVREAREELSVGKIFAEKYWAEDGNWKYDVPSDDVVFADVANAHPLVRKWNGIVDELVRRWGIDRTVLEGETGERIEREEGGLTTGGMDVKKPLDW